MIKYHVCCWILNIDNVKITKLQKIKSYCYSGVVLNLENLIETWENLFIFSIKIKTIKSEYSI
jgi:hypothetical protein